MSTDPKPPPAVIGSGKSHTVSLKQGSNVATSPTARKRDEGKGDDLTSRLMATLRKGEEASQNRRGKRSTVPPATPTPEVAHTEVLASSDPAGLSSAIQQRIAQLRQRNTEVSAEIDRLPASGPTAAPRKR
jgi:hypothetical protein